jgi:hypothetical protein
VALAAIALCASMVPSAQTDLDGLMKQVLARRDDNWKKLQQYILDEHDQIELRGPSRQPLWGEARDYTWFLRDGYFVRSPVRFNGVAISETDRRKSEAEYLDRLKRRDARQRERDQQPSDTRGASVDAPSIDNLIQQTRQPEFISSAYFLRFRFEEGRYALVGRETLDGRDVLRVEYYPSNLYSHDQRRRQATSHDKADPYDAEMQRALNKVALVTLWIEPTAHQIVKYTFDNIGFDFLPAQWLVRIDSVRASMTMGQPFPDVWLPNDLDVSAALTLAAGPIDAHFAVTYRDYRRADVKTKVRIPQGR